MKRLTIATAAVLACWGLVAQGGSLAALCQDDLAQNRQPNFADGGFQSLKTVQVVGSPAVLRLNTNLDVLNPQKIVLPFDQNVSISYVYEAGGAGWAVGWMYADDLVKRGYLTDGGTLTDSDNDGIPDLHEDIYNVSQARYIGKFRKCGASPPTFTWNGKTLVEPEIASDTCTATYATTSKSAFQADGGIGTVSGWTVGKSSGSYPTTPTVEFTDNGLYARIPNLLEPADPANNALGLGHLIFLNADDDSDTTTKSLVPVADISTKVDGVPDYDVSAYDGNGRPLPAGSNPDPGVSLYDRTMNLGTLQGGREIIFYLIVYYSQSQSPCLGRIGGVCKLWLNSPINVWFSRSDLNMDENLSFTSPAATVDIGCGYPSTCTIDGGTYTGWLDSATLTRLASPDGGYGSLVMPHEVASVARSGTNRMPHVIVGAPSTDPFRWILGFEDLSGGGDRDFNDVVFQINKSNGGTVTSGVVSSDLSPSAASDFTITNIRFKKDDTVNFQASGPANACAGPPAASIDYYVAVDCNICSGGVCATNPSPSWTRVPLPSGNPAEVTFNVLDLGFTGSQLCWQARLSSPNQYCQPTINSVSVGYQAVRAGAYTRSSLSTVGNAYVYGTYETPGQSWTGPWPTSPPAPSSRNYDGKPDLSVRGHLYLKSIYDPEKPDLTNPVQRWDSGGKLVTDYTSQDPAAKRRLLTVNSSGKIASLSSVNSAEDLLLPATQLCRVNGGKYVFDLNQDGVCTSTDRDFLKDWLYGWEDNQQPLPAGVHRSWPMGGVKLSTPAVVGPPTYPSWYYTTTSDEQTSYQTRFISGVLNGSPLSARNTYTYVNTNSGVLHSFAAGHYTPSTSDPCLGQTGVTSYRGFFQESGACVSPPGINPRNYGVGAERFAFLPRRLLGRYVNNYVGPTITGAPAASLDASPAVADVDLGGLSSGTLPWTISSTVGLGAKTMLVSAEGKGQSSIFALDITQPDLDTYPIFQWEFDMSSVASAFASAKLGNSTVLLPDTNGTRHAPVVARVDFGTSASADCGSGTGSCRKWVAAVGTDYAPGSSYAGAIYLIDLATGLPVVVKGQQVGVVPIEQGEGVGGEPAFGDATPGDGTSDVLYVPSTSGRVYRLNLSQRDETKALGQRIPKCQVASAPLAVGGSDGPLEQIHSGLVSRPGPLANSKWTVLFFFGTGDNPDDPYDSTASKYYVFGYADPDPLGACPSVPLAPTWRSALDPGQRVWGGVSLDANYVYVTTAVGNAADACNLSSNVSGKYYSFGQGDGVAQAGSGKDLGGHALNSPVIYDGHVLSVSVTGQGAAYGDASWNNKTNFTPATAPRVILWDVSTQSKLPK
jgi:type IV pilus assembly protein PilY1